MEDHKTRGQQEDLSEHEDKSLRTKTSKLTSPQLNLVKSLHQSFPEEFKKFFPEFQVEEAIHSDIDLILRRFKRVIQCGGLLKEKLAKYEPQLLELFQLSSIEEMTIKQFEQACFKFPEIDRQFVSNNFRTYSFDTPFIYNDLFEYGYQTSRLCPEGKMYYLKFYDLLMIDIDRKALEPQTKDLDSDQIVSEFCRNHPSFLFSKWETVNGCHYICLSHAIPSYHTQAFHLMEALNCDQWYIIFSGRYGFKYRLSPKIRDNEEIDRYVARYAGQIGNGQPHPKCQLMVKIYEQFLEKEHPLKQERTGTFYDSFVDRIILYNHPLRPPKLPEIILPEGLNPSIFKSIRKPQQLIEGAEDYYVALDQKTHTFYMAFRDLCLIDLDLHKIEGQDVSEHKYGETTDSSQFDIFKWCEEHFSKKRNAIEIYRSLHGYHLFLIDKARPHDRLDQVEFMRSRGCDFYYAVFSYLRGYCVRLNKKQYKTELDPIYSYVGRWGTNRKINQRLAYLTKSHYQQMLAYQKERPCLMR